MTTTAQRDFTAIGQLASRVGKTVRAIEQAAEELGITPAMRINLVTYFDAAQVEQLTQKLRGQR